MLRCPGTLGAECSKEVHDKYGGMGEKSRIIYSNIKQFLNVYVKLLFKLFLYEDVRFSVAEKVGKFG